MPDSAELLGAFMLGALVLYALTGGADFGGGVWDLFGTKKQHDAIDRALGPIWEANHVWLILVVTVLFTGFPRAFAGIMTALHVPLLLLLLAIVARGAAFTFRHYDPKRDAAQRRWGVPFSIASIAAPVLLGVVVGALASGELRPDASNGFVEPWLGAFPILTGAFTLALFAWLAAVYLCVEAHEGLAGVRDEDLVSAFRVRAFAAWCVSAILGAVLLFVAPSHAPIAEGLRTEWWSYPLVGAGMLAGAVAIALVWKRRWRPARLAAQAQIALVVLGWGAWQHPALMAPELTLRATAAPESVLRLLLIALTIGSIVLFPSLFVLYRSFKGEHPLSVRERDSDA